MLKQDTRFIKKQIIYQSDRLIQFNLESISKLKKYIFDKSEYEGLCQSYIEKSEEIEKKKPREIDWDSVNKETDTIFESVSKEAKVSDPFCMFTFNLVSNYLIYEQMYPESQYNVWKDLVKKISQDKIILLNMDDKQKKIKMSMILF